MITLKDRRYIAEGLWITPPISDIKVTYEVKKRGLTPVLRSSKDLYDYLVSRWPDIDHYESFVAVYVNRANTVIGSMLIGMGSVTGTVADPKKILQTALLLNACSVMLAHNHPSGSLRPSNADETLTRKIKEGAALMDINVLDHIILSPEGYYSFADEGLL